MVVVVVLLLLCRCCAVGAGAGMVLLLLTQYNAFGAEQVTQYLGIEDDIIINMVSVLQSVLHGFVCSARSSS
jgi:hypothetical protein